MSPPLDYHEEHSESTLTDAQRDELDRRIDEDDANPGNDVPWEQVKAQIFSRFK